MKRLAGAIILVASVLSLAACPPGVFAPKGHWNPGDDNYDPATDPANTADKKPFAPMDLVATVVSASEIDLAWRDTSAHETGFRVYVKVGSTGAYAAVTPDLDVDAEAFQSTDLQPSTAYTFRVCAFNDIGESDFSNEAAATTSAPSNTAPTVSISEGDANVANGVQATFTAAGDDLDGDTLTYQWYVDGSEQAGETATTFSLSRSPATQTAYAIKVVVSDGLATGEDTVTLTVRAPGANSAPTVSISEGDVNVANGAQATFTAVGDDLDGDTLTYQWCVDGAEQAGETATTFSITRSPTTQTTYAIKIVVSDGLATGEDTATLTVAAPVTVLATEIWRYDGGAWTQYAVFTAGVVALVDWSSTLYVLAGGGVLYREDGGWTAEAVGAPAGAVSLADVAGSLYALDSGGELYVLDGDWAQQSISAPASTVAITGVQGVLYALTSAPALYLLDGGSWKEQPVPAGTVSITAYDGAACALVAGGDVYVQDGGWTLLDIQVPTGTISIAGGQGTLYATLAVP